MCSMRDASVACTGIAGLVAVGEPGAGQLTTRGLTLDIAGYHDWVEP